MTILQLDETCWRIETAHRLSFLIDTESYYSALLGALAKARHSVWILGWAFDPRTRLAPDGAEAENEPDEVGQILIRMKRANPGLDVRVLIWKSRLSLKNSHMPLAHRTAKAFRGTGIDYREDGLVPLGACHHQKVVVIDGALAFCGGADLQVNRFDTLGHVHGDPRRIKPNHHPHPPRHEVMALMDGPAAVALADLFRARWLRVFGEDLPEVGGHDTWPDGQAPHVEETEVAIARTLPAVSGEPLIDEILRLHLACIASARECIYLENQYFTSHLVAEALAKRLAEPDGPEVILVVTGRAPSWFDRLTMDPARAAMVRRLKAADRYGRFRAYAPITSQGEIVVVHSKVSIFDDAVARVGSANLNNRSEGYDTECEVVFEAGDETTRREIAQLRDVLIAHYLAIPERDFAAAHGSSLRLIDQIDELNQSGRLRPLTESPVGLWQRFVSRIRLGDPAGLAKAGG